MKRIIQLPTRKNPLPGIALALLAILAVSCAIESAPAVPPKAAGTPASITSSQLSWTDTWNKTIAAAKAEKKLVVYSGAGPELRQQVVKEVSNKFGIDVEWFPGRPSELIQRILGERRAGIYSVDVLISLTMSTMNFLKPTGALEPLEPKLVLPEVVDKSKWLQERLWWVDNERTHIAYFALAMPAVLVNTDLVKADEIRSYNDLLNAKWKGKIVMDDPTQGGPGNSWVTAVGEVIMGEDFLRKLAKQEPVILGNQRQEVEWVARGKNPVGVGMSGDNIASFKRAGAPIEVVIPQEGTFLSQSNGAMSLLDRSPHPNAAKVYLNWALSQEGQTIISRAEGLQSARIDVPTDFVEPYALRQPGVKYFDTIKFEYQLKKQDYIVLAKQIFAGVLPK